MVCPLCEHSQDAGDACERCGRELVAAWDPPASIETLPGLESGRAPAILEKGQTLQELEATTYSPTADAPAFSLTGAETTQLAPADNVASLPIQAFDRGRELVTRTPFDPEEPQTPFVLCHNCNVRNPAGERCSGCGIRLPMPEE